MKTKTPFISSTFCISTFQTLKYPLSHLLCVSNAGNCNSSHTFYYPIYTCIAMATARHTSILFSSFIFHLSLSTWLGEMLKLLCRITAWPICVWTLIELIIFFSLSDIHLTNFWIPYLTGPLVNNPVSDLDKEINKLRVKYMSYIVEYGVEAVSMLYCFEFRVIMLARHYWYFVLLFSQGVVCLPNIFGADFGDEIGRFATLIDPKDNQFQVLVERINLPECCLQLDHGDVIGEGPFKWMLFWRCCCFFSFILLSLFQFIKTIISSSYVAS